MVTEASHFAEPLELLPAPLPLELLATPPLLELLDPDVSAVTSAPESEPALVSELHAKAPARNPAAESPKNQLDRSIRSALRRGRPIRTTTTAQERKPTFGEPRVLTYEE